MSEQVDVTVDGASARARVDRVLAGEGALSRSRIQGLIANGHLLVNGMTVTEPARRVKHGDRLTLTIPDPAPAEPEPESIALEVVYEDGELIVVNKPAGMVVHPAPGHASQTLVNALLAHCGTNLTGIGGERRPGIVHRLDKDTSGLLVAAKTERAHTQLTEQFAAHTVARSYTALVHDVPAHSTGTITGAIGRDPRDRKRMAVVPRGGRAARTHYTLDHVYAGGAVSALTCRLATGRTHQVRVHLQHAGWPLVGEPTYTARRAGRTLPASVQPYVAALNRQALHARELGFYHPADGRWVHMTRGEPRAMRDLMVALAAA